MLTRQIESHTGVVTSNKMMAANPNSPALVKTIDMQKGYIDAMHQHTWHQVIFPLKGLLQTQTEHYQHLVPHTSALFVPAGISHESIALSIPRLLVFTLTQPMEKSMSARFELLH